MLVAESIFHSSLSRLAPPGMGDVRGAHPSPGKLAGRPQRGCDHQPDDVRPARGSDHCRRPAVRCGQEQQHSRQHRRRDPRVFPIHGRSVAERAILHGPEQNAQIALVNESFARQFFPGEDPVGKRFKEGGPERKDAWITVVGVVGDMHRRGLNRAHAGILLSQHRANHGCRHQDERGSATARSIGSRSD